MKKRKLILSLSFVMMVSSVVPLGGVPDVRAKEITSKIVLVDNVDSFTDIEVEKNIESYESLKIAGISDVPMEAGTYYFAVHSENGTYSSSSSYTVNIKKIGGVADENIVPFMAICEEACVVFQTNVSGTKYYVNGNPIDIRYEYKFSSSNNNGLQNLSITLKDSDKIRCQIWKEETQGPEVVFYRESTKPYRTVGSKPLLHLLFYGEPDADFYDIACLGTGSYQSDTLYKQPDYVIVLIDPDTGKLVDISEYNYFYQHIMGGNRIIYNKPYTMSFGYNLRDYIN